MAKEKLKAIPLSVLIFFGLMGLGSAALLTYYGQAVGTAEVQQAISLNGNNYDTPVVYAIGNSALAGNTYEDGPLSLQNNAESSVDVGIQTTQEADYGSGTENASDAVTTRYFGELTLENKNSTWDIISDGTSGELKYYLQGSEFEYEFSAEGLQADKNYSLIYYADKPDRFENWGGNNPGALIATFTTNSSGDIATVSGSKNLGMNLPNGDDANIDQYDYCVSDNYDLCHGAKVQLVTSSDYDTTSNKLIAWNPSNYLFETDLISYSDSDSGTSYTAYQGVTEFFVENMFESDAMPGNYTITTSVLPV